MGFKKNKRGVSEVIGAILMFGLIVMLLAILQTQAVPAANENVEFNHNADVQSQLVDFHQAAADTARIGDSSSTKLDMGARYPNRFLFFNPPSPAGSLQTSDEETVRIENLQAEDETAGKYLNDGPIEISTRNLSYQPNYNEYDNAPATRYEYGVLYNDHRSGSQLLVNDGGVIQGRDISLLMPAGELRETSQRAMSIDPRPVSAPANSVAVTGDDPSQNLTLTLPSSMNTTLWEEAVDTTHVRDVVRTGSGEVEVRLDPSETYSLRMARIGIGDDTPEQTSEYLYPTDGLQMDIPQGQSRSLDLEVRDAYNNPVPHENVTVAIQEGAGDVDLNTSSGRDGVATPRFEAPTEPQRVTVNATLDGNFDDFDPDTDSADVQLDVWVTRYAGGIGDPPTISVSNSDGSCESGGIGDWLDDPIDTTFGEDSGAFGVEWTTTPQDDYGIERVDIQLIRNDNGQVVDTAQYSSDGADEVSQDTSLVDPSQCSGTYDIRIVSETTGSATQFHTIEDIDPNA